jgi:translation initiation factor 2B subunit (eIF-2B alpha/beta/delta family)
MSRLVETSDDRFKGNLATYLRTARESLKIIEQVVSNVDRFKREDFMDELRKVAEHAREAEAFALRDAVRRIHPG